MTSISKSQPTPQARPAATPSPAAARSEAPKAAPTATPKPTPAKPDTYAKATAAATPKPAITATPTTTSSAVQQASSGAKGPQAKANMEKLQASPDFKKLSAASQQKALETMAANPTSASTAENLGKLIGAKNFQTLPATQQWKALDVFSKTTLDGQKSIVDLTNRSVGSPPKSALADVDAKGGTLLDSLHKIATEPLADGFSKNGIGRDSLIATVAQEAANPGEINQSARNTCGATSVQYLLSQKNPAEYVRLTQGLLSPEGSVQMRNGDTLRRVADSIAPDNATGRSNSERIFQSAMMDYSDGALKSYSNEKDKSSYPIASLGNQGLMAWEVTHGMNATLGGKYDTYFGGLAFTEGGRQKNMVDTLKDKLPGDSIALLKWSDGGNHFVAVDKIENGRVYFRNPWGSAVGATGSTPSTPPRRVEDGPNGHESMSVEDFQKRLLSVSVPDNNVVPFFV